MCRGWGCLIEAIVGFARKRKRVDARLIGPCTHIPMSSTFHELLTLVAGRRAPARALQRNPAVVLTLHGLSTLWGDCKVARAQGVGFGVEGLPTAYRTDFLIDVSTRPPRQGGFSSSCSSFDAAPTCVQGLLDGFGVSDRSSEIGI